MREVRASGPAFHCMGKTISFGELDRMSRDFGAWLQSKGLAKGARVAIMMPNCCSTRWRCSARCAPATSW